MGKSHTSDIPEWAVPAVASLLNALKAVDPSTYAHCLRVGEYSFQLAQAMGLNEFEQRVAEYAGILHDVGKMGVPGGLINKPAKLSPMEMSVVASHPILSEEIVRPLAHHPFFQQLLPAIRGHHERMDGRGYPDGLAGEQIPLTSRLILVVDTLDAMGEDRVYRKALPQEKIFEELKRCSGTQFDSRLVQIFLDSFKFWSKNPPRQDSLQNLIGRAQPSASLPKAA